MHLLGAGFAGTKNVCVCVCVCFEDLLKDIVLKSNMKPVVKYGVN